MNGQIKLRTVIFAVLIAIMVGVSGLAFRGYTLRLYSDLPSGFDGSLFYRRVYLLEHAQFLTTNIETYSFWSNGVNMRLGIYVQELIYAVVYAISGVTNITHRWINQILLTTGMIALSNLLLLQNRNHLKAKSGVNLFDVLIVSSFSTLGTPVVINYLTGWDSAYGWVLLLALSVVVTSRLRPGPKICLSFFLTALGPPLYHTFGFFMICFISFAWLFGKLAKTPKFLISPLPLIIYYLTFQIYVSTEFFKSIASGVADILTLHFIARDLVSTSGTLAVYNLRYLHIIIWMLILVPIIFGFLRFVAVIIDSWNIRIQVSCPPVEQILQRIKNLEGEPITGQVAAELPLLSLCIAACCAVFLLAIIFAMKFDLTLMINRGAEYLFIPALLSIIYELRNRGKGKTLIYSTVSCAILLSLVSFWIQARTIQSSNYITTDEANGYYWLEGRISPEDVVFTDFRLSGPFIAHGHFRVVGITGQGVENTRQLLKEIYFDSHPATISQSIRSITTAKENQAANYLFLSKEMLNDFPGINGFGTQFGKVSENFFVSINQSQEWTPVFSNDDILIYQWNENH